MKKSLFKKYLSVTSIIIVVSFLFLGTVMIVFIARYFQSEKQAQLTQNAKSMASIAGQSVVMMQDNQYLIDGSRMALFIKAFSENVDAERVKTVLEQVGLRERVARMKDGAHTLLGHDIGDGELLSGGEEQKLAIARALYKDAPFVILDEPTAALDPIAEAEIYENFDALVGKKTAIYISHRMSSCKFGDRIIVLDSGRLAEAGTHETLMRQEGIYYALYEAQAKHYAE